jgi:cytoskeletal protein CcmA (bactofilin family)
LHKEKQLTQKNDLKMAAISFKTKTKEDAGELSGLKVAASSARASDGNCVVSKGTLIEGGFASSENIRLDGRVSGTLKCEKRLVIGEAGRVDGQVTAAEAVIMGAVMGDVIISGSLHLMNTAKIQGDITAKFLVVDEGAVYNGKCQIGGKG